MDGCWLQKQNALGEARIMGKFCDFQIRVKQETFPVHRVVLDSFSEYFRAMFASGMLESKQRYCEMNEDDPTVVKQCIEFMYTGNLDLNKSNAVDILYFSHRILLQSVVDKCEEFLISAIDPTTCVDFLNAANLYDLQNLKTAGNNYIKENLQSIDNLHRLGEIELRNLMQTVTDSSENSCLAWNILRMRIVDVSDSGELPCNLIKEFPVEGLTTAVFKSTVLKDNHIRDCMTCKEHVRLRRKIHLYEMQDIDTENCLKVRTIAVRFGVESLVLSIDNFILENFEKVSLTEDFIKLMNVEELLFYASKLQRPCSKTEFTSLIRWLKKSKERHGSFAKNFFNQAGDGNRFLCSIASLTIRESKSSSSKGRSQQDEWLIDDGNCCYVKSLAEKHSCDFTAERANDFVMKNFAIVAESHDVGSLSTESMQQYVSTERLYELNDGKSICTAISAWVKSDNGNKAAFPVVFRSMLLHKLPSKYLQKISENRLVTKSTEFLSKLVAAAFLKTSTIEAERAAMKNQITRLQKISEKYQHQEKLINDIRSSLSSISWRSFREVGETGILSIMLRSEISILKKEMELQRQTIQRNNRKMEELRDLLKKSAYVFGIILSFIIFVILFYYFVVI